MSSRFLPQSLKPVLTHLRARRACCRVVLAYYFTLSKVEFPTAVTDEITKIRLSPHINPHTHSLSLSDAARLCCITQYTHSIFSARAHSSSHAPLPSRGGERERGYRVQTIYYNYEDNKCYFENSAARESQRLVRNVSIHSYFVTDHFNLFVNCGWFSFYN